MGLVGRGRNWLRSITARRRLEREMLEEMAAHIDQAAERFRAGGMSERDALLAARREFGQLAVVQEEARDARGSRWIDSIIGDLRYAVRHFARTPLTTVTIVLTLTLGIGATASMFSVTDGVFNRPPPGVPDDPALVMIRGIEVDRDGARGRLMSWPEVVQYAALTDRFTAVAAWATSDVIVEAIDGVGGVGSVRAQFVTPNLFSTLRIRLASGPGFVEKDIKDLSQPELTAVVSETFAERLGGGAQAVGKEVKLNGVSMRVVGVAPHRFNGPTRHGNPHTVWLPLSAYPVVMHSTSQAFANRDTAQFRALARLQPRVTIARATQAVRLVATTVDASFGTADRPEQRADVVSLRGDPRVQGISRGDIEQTAVAGVVVLLVLLVCSTTVSSLLVGAAVARRQEIGIRLALGASRARIVRQLLTENAILALTGGVLGVLVFAWVCRLLAALLIDVDVTPDWTTAGFTMISAMVTALLCGLSPALHATRSGVADVLKDGVTGATARSRLQRVFVVAQIALTQPLLVGLAVMTAVALRGVRPHPGSALGDRVVIAAFNPYVGTLANAPDPMPSLARRLSGLPGVAAVVPERMGFGPMTLELARAGSRTVFKVRAQGVAPGYFRALDIPVVLGREFAPAEMPDTVGAIDPPIPNKTYSPSPVLGERSPAIIGTNAAKRLFGAASPIGQRLYQLSNNGNRIGELEIVGVVASEQIGARDDDEQLRVFIPSTDFRRVPVLLIRTVERAEPLIPALHALVRAEAPMLPISGMQTLEQVDRERREEVIRESAASAAAGMVALLLASIGLYAVVAIAVGQRRREIGVRIAVGANPRQVVAIFFTSGLRLCLIGLLIGVPLGVAGFKILAAQVGALETNMLAIAAIIAVVVVAVASLATWLPARRAAGVDPLIALRAE